MNGYLIDAAVSLMLMGYFVWACFTVYFVMIAKKVEGGATLLGKVIWYHGAAVIFLMIFIAGVTIALLLTRYLAAVLSARIIIGG